MCVLSDCAVRIETGLWVICLHYVVWKPTSEILLTIWLLWTTQPECMGVACRGHWPLGTSSAQFTVYSTKYWFFCWLLLYKLELLSKRARGGLGNFHPIGLNGIFFSRNVFNSCMESWQFSVLTTCCWNVCSFAFQKYCQLLDWSWSLREIC